jgi:hypothetical protein
MSKHLGPLDVAPRHRAPHSFRSVAIGGAALAALLVAVAMSLYFRYIHYERIAARHVPQGSVLAVRLDVEQVTLYEPVRRHLIPLLGGPGRSPPDAAATLARLEERTQLKRADLREIVVARGADRSEWTVVLGGIFPRGTSPAVLASALAAEDPAWAPSLDATVVVHRGTGVAVTRATDGAVIIASSLAGATAAVPARDSKAIYGELGLPPTGPGALAMREPGLEELARWPGLLADQTLSRGLSGIRSLRTDIGLDERPSVTVTLTEGEPGAATITLQRGLELAKALDPSEASPGALLLRAGAQRSKVAPPAHGTAAATLVWERPEVDQAFELVAEAIQDHWR